MPRQYITRTAYTCLVCGTTFLLLPCQVAAGQGKYCSRACYNARPRQSLAERFWANVDQSGECWLWTGGRTASGYGRLSVGHNAKIQAHRVAWELAHGPIPPGMFVCHHCDTPLCVRLDHLFLGTPQDNSRDMARKGRQGFQQHPERAAFGQRNARYTHPETTARGERSGQARLTEERVREIRALRAAGWTQLRIAQHFGVAKATVWYVLQGRNWQHVV